MKLMEQVRQVLRVRHYSLATEQCYCQWIRRFIFFHGVKHPNNQNQIATKTHRPANSSRSLPFIPLSFHPRLSLIDLHCR
jgi:hypothetical protein